MSFVTKLEADSQKFQVLDFTSQISSVVDSRGVKAGSVKASKTKFTVSAKGQTTFVSTLMTDQFVPYPLLEFITFDQVEKKEMRKFEAKESVLVGFSLDIDVFSDTIATYTVEVTSKETITNGVSHKMNWSALAE